jgi:hypothetical protein
MTDNPWSSSPRIGVDSYCIIALHSAACDRHESSQVGHSSDLTWRIVRVTSVEEKPTPEGLPVPAGGLKSPAALSLASASPRGGGSTGEYEGLSLQYLGDVQTLLKTFAAHDLRVKHAEALAALQAQQQVASHHGSPEASTKHTSNKDAPTKAHRHGSIHLTASTSIGPNIGVSAATMAAATAAAAVTYKSFTEAVGPAAPRDVIFQMGLLDHLRLLMSRGGLHLATPAPSPGSPTSNTSGGGNGVVATSSSPSTQNVKKILRTSLVLGLMPKPPTQPSARVVSTAPGEGVTTPPPAGVTASSSARPKRQHAGSPAQTSLNNPGAASSFSLDVSGTTGAENSSNSNNTAGETVSLTPQSVNTDVAIFSVPSDPSTFASYLVRFSMRDVLCVVPHLSLEVAIEVPTQPKVPGGRGGSGFRSSQNSVSGSLPSASAAKKKQSVKIEDPTSSVSSSPSISLGSAGGKQSGSGAFGNASSGKSSGSKSIVDLTAAPVVVHRVSSALRIPKGSATTNPDVREEPLRALLVDPQLLALLPVMLHVHRVAESSSCRKLSAAEMSDGGTLTARRLTRPMLETFKASMDLSPTFLRQINVSFYSRELLDSDAAQLASIIECNSATLQSLCISSINHVMLHSDLTRIVTEAEACTMGIEASRKRRSKRSSGDPSTATTASVASDRDEDPPSLMSFPAQAMSCAGVDTLLGATMRWLRAVPSRRLGQVTTRLVLRHLQLDERQLFHAGLLKPDSFRVLQHMDLSYNAAIGDEFLTQCLALVAPAAYYLHGETLSTASEGHLESLLLAGNIITDHGALEVQRTFLLDPTAARNAPALRVLDLRCNKITELCKDTVLAPISVPRLLTAWSRDVHARCDRRVRRRIILVWSVIQSRLAAALLPSSGQSSVAVNGELGLTRQQQQCLNRRKKRVSQGLEQSDMELLLCSFASFLAPFNRTLPIFVMY